MLRCLCIALLIGIFVPFGNKASARTVTIDCPPVDFPGIEVSVQANDGRLWQARAPIVTAIAATESFGNPDLRICPSVGPDNGRNAITR